MNADAALRCIDDIVTALKYAHAKGICHLDLRYKNIVEASARYILIDWGMSAFAKRGDAGAEKNDFRQLGWVIVGLTSNKIIPAPGTLPERTRHSKFHCNRNA